MPQLTKPENVSEQQQQAIDWLVRLRSDEMSDDELYEFAEWLALDHANSEAFSSAETLYDQMTLAAIQGNEKNQDMQESPSSLTLNMQLKQGQRPPKRYSRLLIPFFAIAAIWLISVALFPPQQLHLLDKLLSDYYTQTGELREIELSDGSRLLLNTNSAVSVDYNDTMRKIILHHGQVRFTVAKEVSRPFEVIVDNLNVRALGTIFQIYKPDGDDVKITVQEHAIAVSITAEKNNSRQHAGVTVQAGQQLHFQLDNALPDPQAIKLKKATAWQQQRLIINDQPLGDLIVELERYRNGRIFVADQMLKNLRITGVFSLENPEGVLNTICNVLNLKQTQLGVWSVLHR
jgi:transmembrane sensor